MQIDKAVLKVLNESRVVSYSNPALKDRISRAINGYKIQATYSIVGKSGYFIVAVKQSDYSVSVFFNVNLEDVIKCEIQNKVTSLKPEVINDYFKDLEVPSTLYKYLIQDLTTVANRLKSERELISSKNSKIGYMAGVLDMRQLTDAERDVVELNRDAYLNIEKNQKILKSVINSIKEVNEPEPIQGSLFS